MAIFIDYTGDNVETDFPFSFPYLQESHVILDIDGVRYNTSSTGGTYTFTIESGPLVRVTPAPANNAVIRIYRNSRGLNNDNLDALYDFTDGSVVTEDQLDGIYLHNLYLAQESTQEKINSIGAAAGSVLIYDATNTNWKVLPLNLQYDSTNDTFGFGGTSSSDYKFRFNGDTIIREDGTSNGAVLTIENTDVTNQQATLIVSASTPQVQFKDLNGDTDKKFFLQNYQNGVYQLVAQTDAGNAKSIIPLRLQEDGKTVLGGTSSQNADASYQHTMYGDVVIYDDTETEATLTVQSTHSSGPDAAVLRLIADSPTVSLYDDNGATDQKTMQVGFGTGSLDFAFYPDAGGTAYAVPLQLTTDGSAGGVILNGLPTSDPSVSGQLWNRGGHVAVSGQLPAIYDSGWVTSLNGTALAANTTMAVVIDEDFFNNLVFRNVKVFARDSSDAYSQFIPIPTSYIVEETSGGTQFSVGVKWSAQVVSGVYYINFTTGDYATLETDAPTIYNWVTDLDEIRVVIT